MIPRDDAIYAVKAIIAYGATPKTERPIEHDEIMLKAGAEGYAQPEAEAALGILLKMGDVMSPAPDAYRLTLKGEGGDAL